MSGVPVADIVDEVSWNQDKNTVIYNVNEPSPEYDKSTVPVISGNEEVGRVSLPHDWMRKGVNKIAKANTEGMDFNPRDFIGAVLLNQWEWPTMKDGKLYEIVTKHDGAFVKRVKNRINDSSKIICLSDNPAYSPIHLNVKDVDQIWEVSFRVSWDFPIPDRVSYLESEVDDMKIVIGKIYEEIKGMKGK